ncbi:leucocin A/sakacin P family class II bacteriocin [Latilactobacillus sakei]|uniref:leucocin A/sakacin P family class II bacteriocin n=1 Tax=Latilactobacillus sakei TaxID=1599 RepID=UPI003F538CD9
MNNYSAINELELKSIKGGKITHYANGVSCNTKTGTCSVNWNQAASGIGKIIVNGWAQHGPFSH